MKVDHILHQRLNVVGTVVEGESPVSACSLQDLLDAEHIQLEVVEGSRALLLEVCVLGSARRVRLRGEALCASRQVEDSREHTMYAHCT